MRLDEIEEYLEKLIARVITEMKREPIEEKEEG
jgi:hypothetical protein